MNISIKKALIIIWTQKKENLITVPKQSGFLGVLKRERRMVRLFVINNNIIIFIHTIMQKKINFFIGRNEKKKHTKDI